MITYLDTEVIDSATTRIEAMGLSTDTKPTMYSNRAVGENSLFLELDTKTLYYCSKSGGESEEVVYEGEVNGGATLEGVTALSDTITVNYDGAEYTVEKFEYDDPDNGVVNVWGASFDSQGEIDFSVYPFQISNYYEDEFGVYFADDGSHSLSITSLVTTEAEWTEYGEAPSGGGGIVGNLADGVTIHESDWIYNGDDYHVEVEPYILESRVQYILDLTANGSDQSDTVTAVRDELESRYVTAVFFNDSITITYDSEEGRTFVHSPSNEEITLHIGQADD